MPEKYTDETTIPFGKYKGERLEKVPAGYLLYLWDKPDGFWQQPLHPMHAYIKESFSILESQEQDFIIIHFPNER